MFINAKPRLWRGLLILGDNIFYGALEHLSNADQCLNRWVLVSTAFELDNGVIVNLGFLGKLIASQLMLSAQRLNL